MPKPLGLPDRDLPDETGRRRVAQKAVIEPEAALSDAERRRFARAGLPVRDAWMTAFLSDTDPQAEELVVTGSDITACGGFEKHRDDIDDLKAAVWPLRSAADIREACSHLTEGRPARDARKLADLLAVAVADKSAVVIAARTLGSRKVTGLVAFSRAATVFPGSAAYDIVCGEFVDLGAGAAGGALRACFYRQVEADLKTLARSLKQHGFKGSITVSCDTNLWPVPRWVHDMTNIANFVRGDVNHDPEFKDAVGGDIDIGEAYSVGM